MIKQTTKYKHFQAIRIFVFFLFFFYCQGAIMSGLVKEDCMKIYKINKKFQDENFFLNQLHIRQSFQINQIAKIKNDCVQFQVLLDLYQIVSNLKDMHISKKNIFQRNASNKVSNVYFEAQHVLDYITLKSLNKININDIETKVEMNIIEDDLIAKRLESIWGEDTGELKKTHNQLKQKIRTFEFKYATIFSRNNIQHTI